MQKKKGGKSDISNRQDQQGALLSPFVARWNRDEKKRGVQPVGSVVCVGIALSSTGVAGEGW